MGAKQVGMGLSGFFIIHPRNPPPEYAVDHDYCYFLQIWMIHPGSSVPDTMEMSDFNYFTMNGRPSPDIVPMAARSGERVRIRVANLSMLTHPIHLHGHTFKVSEYGAGFVPIHQQIIANTVNISSAEVRSLDFQAYRPGKWLFHCHFMHHVMNDMHRNPIPGTNPGHAAHDMGGMHTWIEITA
jgi:FtsP/CotA-like multicopper oxidase with cupredoxin domain